VPPRRFGLKKGVDRFSHRAIGRLEIQSSRRVPLAPVLSEENLREEE
jgi:hypothetical protein